MLICLACRGIPGPIRASGGNGTGCIPPSADTWKLYALLEGVERLRRGAGGGGGGTVAEFEEGDDDENFREFWKTTQFDW